MVAQLGGGGDAKLLGMRAGLGQRGRSPRSRSWEGTVRRSSTNRTPSSLGRADDAAAGGEAGTQGPAGARRKGRTGCGGARQEGARGAAPEAELGPHNGEAGSHEPRATPPPPALWRPA